MKEIAKKINCLAEFCGKRDIPELNNECLKNNYDIDQTDMMVLFGGSILQGGDLLAEAMENNVAKNYIIVGGYGHTSSSLFKQAEEEIPSISKGINSEAELFSRYIEEKYQLPPDFLETKSTNCGNNITNLLTLIEENHLSMENILLVQDATMQLRMEATIRKYLSNDIPVINFASYQATLINVNNCLEYSSKIRGAWDIDRYVSLLMGEIPRLKDTAEGYGPKGKNFITHVEVPDNVVAAYEDLKKIFPNATRKANPSFASK